VEEKLSIYCITNLESSFLETLEYNLVGVGEKNFPNKYINCTSGENIQNKEKHYSELTFHYWFWKNELNNLDDDTWIGFCQKRRFWLKSNDIENEIKNLEELRKNLLKETPKDWKNHNAVICKPIYLGRPKIMKLVKRGWKNLIYNPSSVIKRNIKLHFDMHHGYGLLEKASELLKEDDRKDFLNYINNNNYFNPHIMFISKKQILNQWFSDSFQWLFKCEKLFGFENLKGFGKVRIYGFLAERFLSYWFQKNAKCKTMNISFYDIRNDIY